MNRQLFPLTTIWGSTEESGNKYFISSNQKKMGDIDTSYTKSVEKPPKIGRLMQCNLWIK